jgi:5-methylcytosine-specific restriction endonuclease McrA
MKKGTKMTEEARRKIGLARLGKPRPGNPENWKHSEETKKRISQTGLGRLPWNKGRAMTEETKKKVSESKKKFYANGGRHPRGMTGKHFRHSEETRRLISEKVQRSKIGMVFHHSPEVRKRISESLGGSKSHLWRGGITAQNTKVRNSFVTRLWRESVFKRDDYTCQECGQRGGQLHAHHLKPFSSYPESRFDVENGQTLCVECHKKTDTYLNKTRRSVVSNV